MLTRHVVDDIMNFVSWRDVRVWLKEHDWKSCIRETVSRVRIPFSPYFNRLRAVFLCPFLNKVCLLRKPNPPHQSSLSLALLAFSSTRSSRSILLRKCLDAEIAPRCLPKKGRRSQSGKNINLKPIGWLEVLV